MFEDHGRSKGSVTSPTITAPSELDTLVRVWDAHEPSEWREDAGRYVSSGKKALDLGNPTLAVNILSEGSKLLPSNRELRYLLARALADSGSLKHAAKVVRELVVQVATKDASYSQKLHGEALSLAGRIAKAQWSRLPDGPTRASLGEQARHCYMEAYNLAQDYFPGINAATMSALTGHEEDAQRLARALCERSRADPADVGDYWRDATLGEAYVLLGDRTRAIDSYRKSAQSAGAHHGAVASMRRQLKLLASRHDLAGEILSLLSLPKVVAFAGHMIDAQDRSTPRFPAYMEARVQRALAEAIEQHDIGIGYCSAACGADILFIEQMLARGAEVNIVLPFKREDFIEASVSFAGDRWVERFERVMQRATSVSYCVDEDFLGDDVLFAHAGDLIQGLAVLRAQQLETDVALLAAVDPMLERKVGGTIDDLLRWQERGHPAIVLNLREIREQARNDSSVHGQIPPIPPHRSPEAGTLSGDLSQLLVGRRQVKTMLFADMVGYSKLHERQTPIFFLHFLTVLAEEMDHSKHRPAFGNTWGDGLYLVFDDVEDGADFALRLRDAIARIGWETAGLPADMNIRIALHTGPVFKALDPIIKQENFFGSQVTRTARIEPVTAPGSVFVTEQMAAILAASDTRRFACDYLGAMELAKTYGISRLYRLRRMDEFE